MKKPETIILKFSGEYLEDESSIFSRIMINKVARAICAIKKHYDGVYVVIGGGNIARGRELSAFEFRNGSADVIGMLSTIQNAAILKEVLTNMGQKTHVMTPFSAEMMQMSAYEPGLARHLAEEKKHVIIFGGGLGLRGFSTDMTAVSRAYEVSADIVVKITEVGGMFDSDPKVNKNAKRIPYASYREVLQKGYKVMDEEAFVFAKNHRIPIKIIDLNTSKIRPKKILNRKHGTLIS